MSRRTRRRVLRRGAWLLLALAAALSVSVTDASAQVGQGERARRGQHLDRAMLEQRLRQRMAEMIREELGLSPEELSEVERVLGEFDSVRREMAREERAIRRRVEALMLEGGEDQDEAAELLERMVALRNREASVFGEEVARLREHLSPVQILKLQAIRDRIAQRIRQMRRRAVASRPPARPGGGPPA